MSSADPGLPSRRARAFVAFALGRARVIWIAALALAAFGAVRTAWLYSHLRTSMEELLPREAPSVLAIDELRDRVQGLQYLGVVVDTGSPENVDAAERMLGDLAARVRAYGPGLVRDVRLGDEEERAFLEKHAALYLDTGELASILTRIEARRDWEVSRAEGSSLDEDEPPPPLDFSDVEAKLKARSGQSAKTVNGRFASRELHTALMIVQASSSTAGERQAAELLSRVKADVASLGGPDAYAKGMRVGYAGDVAISVEESTALVTDLSISSALVAALVIAVLVYFFRWWRGLVVVLAPLAIATVTAFGLASLPPFSITALNSNTAFLGSIIVGNGINVGIMLLARYLEERRKGVAVEPALELAVWGVRPGTLAASLAASASYGSLVLTSFRGFRQFGVIGGLGMVLAWCAAFLLVPSLVRFLDRGAGEVRPAPAALVARRRHGIAGLVARAVKARPLVIAIAAAALTAGSLVLVTRIDESRLEHDFSKLRRRDTFERGEGYWGRKMDAVLGGYLTPMAILADDAGEARRVERAIDEGRAQGRFHDLVASVRSIHDVLPDDQPAKLAILARIREAMTPRIRAAIPADRRDVVTRLVDASEDGTVGAEDLPPTFTTGLREKSGALDRIVLVYPRPSEALWRGRELVSFVDALRDVAAGAARPGERPARVAATLALSADVLTSIRRDGPRASAFALAGVVAVVLGLFRRSWASVAVVATLLAGVLWMTASSVALDIKINFADFIAFPITFGIGVDYAVNVMSRYVLGGSRDTADAVAATGGAVGLCSATTIIGYSSLLVAENRALFSFGALAVLGELACVLAAVVALPAFLELGHRRRGRRPATVVATGEQG